MKSEDRSPSVEIPGSLAPPQVAWVHPDSASKCLLREAEPGVYHVSAELMHQMMRGLGWKPESEVEAP